METKNYFLKPMSTAQTHYEALRAHFVDGLKIEEAAKKFGLSPAYLNKLKFEFLKDIEQGRSRFFKTVKKGPKKRNTKQETIDLVVSLRKQNHLLS